MTTRIVLDTNVVVSGYLWGGAALEILKRVERGDLVAFACRESMGELERVLVYPKFRLARKYAEEIMEHYRRITVATRLQRIPPVIQEDPTDDVFIALALSCGASFIVSGNHHLLKLYDYRGIRIVSPRQFLTALGC
jgi:putative PIN family toxin of toxin-antitoxin system